MYYLYSSIILNPPKYFGRVTKGEGAATRTFQVELIPDGVTRLIQYSGRPLELKF